MISLFEPVMGLAIFLNDLCYLFNTGLSDVQTNLQPKIMSRRLSMEFYTFHFEATIFDAVFRDYPSLKWNRFTGNYTKSIYSYHITTQKITLTLNLLWIKTHIF
jgi:hypothetical protein